MSELPQLRVRLFAGLREAMGWSERLVQVAEIPATPHLLWRQLGLDQAWREALAQPGHGEPATAGDSRDSETGDQALPEGVRVAINQAFAAADVVLVDGDELAFLPPISGG